MGSVRPGRRLFRTDRGSAPGAPPHRQPATAVKGEHRSHAGTVPARVLLTRREPSQHVTDEGTKGPGGE